MPTTRIRILEILKNKGASSASELSRALKMTAANIRHHLGVLIGEGSVVIVSQQLAPHRGRPTLQYALAQDTHRHNLGGLANALLETFIARLPNEQRIDALQKIANYLASSAASRRSPNLTQRLTEAVKRLNELGYQSRWEAHSEAPRLVLGHCPYAVILPEHPELCQIDAALIRTLLDVTVVQAKKLALDSRGVRYCLFIAGKGTG
jgi:predicted ArsR family transcriptional regulator